MTKPPAPIGNPAVANIIARLCNSNPVKEALPAVLKDILQALGVKVAEDKLKGKKRLRAKDFEKDDEPASGANKAKTPMPESEDEDEEHGGGGGVVMQRRPHSDNEDDLVESDDDFEDDVEDDQDPGAEYDSGDFAPFDSRIAASSDEEDESDDEDAPSKGRVSRKETLRAAAMDISLSPSASPEPKTRKPAKLKERPTTSAFIPSLSMGGYWSGSESEPESDLDDAPRKNRRGQRARQAIAEKKFGTKAKHLQKEGAVSRNDRNQGWDPKRGATDRSGPRARGPHKSGSGRSAPRMDGAPDAIKPAPPKKHRDDSGPLHPSWEAAKKAKEAKVTATFTGKKISFD